MKKKIKIVTIIAIAILGFLNLNIGSINNNKISSLKFTNIEALAEGGLLTCYRTISSSGSGNSTHVTYCQDCSAHLATSWKDKSACDS